VLGKGDLEIGTPSKRGGEIDYRYTSAEKSCARVNLSTARRWAEVERGGKGLEKPPTRVNSCIGGGEKGKKGGHRQKHCRKGGELKALGCFQSLREKA